MSWVPGWDSIASAHWWENFYFWASIVALILLGVMEVVSHRYTERKDELAAAEQSKTQRQHDEEIARLHLQTAALTADAEKSRAAIAEATARAAEANRIAEEERTARLKLLGEISARHLTEESAKKLIGALRGKVPRLTVVWPIADPEALNFAVELTSAFRAAGVEATETLLPAPPSGIGYMTGLIVLHHEESAQQTEGKELVRALSDLNVGPVSEGIAVPTNGDVPMMPEVPFPALYVGLKRPPYVQTDPGLWDTILKAKTAPNKP
jgi:hypothetical protein